MGCRSFLTNNNNNSSSTTTTTNNNCTTTTTNNNNNSTSRGMSQKSKSIPVLLLQVAAVATIFSSAAVVCCYAAGSVHPMHNGGTPPGISPGTDCNLRAFAWEAGKKLMPSRGQFKTLYDALQLSSCGVPGPATTDTWTPPTDPLPPASTDAPVFFVDAAHGSDSSAGTKASPFQTLGHAIEAATRATALTKTIVLRAGTYHGCDGRGGTCHLTSAQSGLTIRNYPAETAVLSGGQGLAIKASDWKRVTPPPPANASTTVWSSMPNQNDVSSRAGVPTPSSDTPCCKYLGQVDSLAACEKAAEAAVAAGHAGPFDGVTFHTPQFSGDFSRHCYGVVTGAWIKPVPQDNIDSARNASAPQATPVYVADLNGLPGGKPAAFDGLRRNGAREIRAKYPNGAPEDSGQWFIMGSSQSMGQGEYVHGWDTTPTTWVPHRAWGRPPQTEVVITADDWPGVEWPMHHPGGDDTWTGEGDWGQFHAGYGGTCDDVTPPFGYWCAKKPPRGISQHWSPSGLVWDGHLKNGANYSHPEDAVVVAWRGGGRWYTNIWAVDDWVVKNKTMLFKKGTGNQGGEGADYGQQWYIENVREELDDAREWFYDERTGMLYYAFNGTAPTEDGGHNNSSDGDDAWVATRSKVLFNVSGTAIAPASDITISGVQIRDTALTWLDPHGLPSGGDWALQRSGAITLEGTRNFRVAGSLFERIDGNGVMLNGYNRNATIAGNEFAWVGATCVASWGYSSPCLNANCTKKLPWRVGPDARGGQQPRGTRIVNNLFREMGIFQKQASAYFHAKSGLTEVAGNVVFNGPRAMFNFNDGMLGGDEVHANLLLNAVRESGDHSAINSWDRMPYIHDGGSSDGGVGVGGGGGVARASGAPASGKPTIIPLRRREHHNFILGTYSTQEAFDTDDGSSYYSMYGNFLVYGANGLKSDFGGHDHSSVNDIYAYVHNCFGNGNFLTFKSNVCILNWQPTADQTGGYASDCHLDAGMVVENNTVATPGGSLLACGTFLKDWVAQGHDKGTKSVQWPSDDQLVAMGRKTLFEDKTWAGGAN